MRKRTSRRLVACITGLAVASGPIVLVDSARATPDEAFGSSVSAEATADLVAEVAPASSTAASSSADGVEVTDNGLLRAGSFTLPADGTGVLTAGDISVTLPQQLKLGAAEITEEGVAVYEGESSSEPAVAIFSDGDSTAVHTVVPSSSSSRRYSYRIQGARPVKNADGSVDLVGFDNRPKGAVASPWAVDAAGQPVATHYEVHGDTLVQVINPTADTAFPVVADPDWWFVAKCSGAIALFAAENVAAIAKVWKVFKSADRLLDIFWDLRGMSFGGKVSYLRTRLGSVFYELSGWSDLINRCTP